MTEHMDLGMNPNFVERNPARYNQTIKEAATHRLLADPIEFSQNMARVLITGLLDDVLMQDAPKQVGDLEGEFSHIMDQAMATKDQMAIEEVWVKYTEFMTYALCEAREYGVAMGAVMEQLRLGLVGVVDLSRRGLTRADCMSHNDLQRLRLKYGLEWSSAYEETDLSKIKDDAATEDAA